MINNNMKEATFITKYLEQMSEKKEASRYTL